MRYSQVRRPSPQAVIGPTHKVTPSESRVGQNVWQKNVAARGYSAVKRASNEELGHASTSALSPGPGRQLDAPHAWRRLMRAQGRVTQEDNPERSGTERCAFALRYIPKGTWVYTQVAAREEQVSAMSVSPSQKSSTPTMCPPEPWARTARRPTPTRSEGTDGHRQDAAHELEILIGAANNGHGSAHRDGRLHPILSRRDLLGL